LNQGCSRPLEQREGVAEGSGILQTRIAIELNGAPRQVRGGSTLDDLLEELGLERGHVAVEVNREIIPKQRWNSYVVQEDDAIEVVHFVGGGEN
jgi:thiamine biosynthesis protein ThiS